jgi:molybdenum cofactor synthesis domain-containing protein
LKAAIFTIGTEVVDGEIVNTNAAWLASQLHDYGFAVTHHVSTSDLELDMKEVLEWLVGKVDWVFVAGGLGPTSDDRTRNVVADVIGEKLVYSHEVWTDLGESYRARGFTVTDDHKQQCFFPENCRKLENPVGSALGFVSELGNARIVVLPGPPAELKAVFSRGVEPSIQELRLRKAKSAKWVCLGITESGAAEKVEEALGGQNLEIGYRADIPYVHVKVWIPDDRVEQPIFDKVNEVIGEYTVSTGSGDPATGFAEALAAFPDHHLQFSDTLSGGKLVMRLSDLNVFASHSVGFANLARDGTPNAKTAVFSLGADDQQGIWARFQIGENAKTQQLKDPPYNVDLSSPRARRYYSEQALHAWAQMLRKM